MKQLINNVKEWYWYNQHVIHCKRMLAENPNWPQMKTELGWYEYLEECTANDIINSVRNFFTFPVRWAVSLFKRENQIDKLPF